MPRTRRSLHREARKHTFINCSSSDDMDSDVDFNFQIEKNMALEVTKPRQTKTPKRARTRKTKQASTSSRKVPSIARKNKNTNISVIDLEDSDDELKSININESVQGKVDDFFKSSGLISDDEDEVDISVNTKGNAMKQGIKLVEVDIPSRSVTADMNNVVIEVEEDTDGINSLEDIENYCKETENLLKNANALLEKFAENSNDDNPQLTKPESNKGENSRQEKGLGECPICYENLSEKQVMSTKCGHLFCKDCIEKIANTVKKCPTCRKAVNKKNIISIYI